MNDSTKEWSMEELRDCQADEIYYGGLKFVLNENGYYRCWEQGHKGLRLHRYIWEIENGQIPEGFHIHHKNENKRNNHISNFELLTDSEHGKQHREQFMGVRIQPELSAEWRKKNYEASKHLLHENVEIECAVCGEVVMKRKYAKYCSKKCNNKYNNNKAKASI